MRGVGRDGEDIAGLNYDALAGDFEAEGAGVHHRDLLVIVMVERDDGALFQREFRDGHTLGVDHSSGNQRVKSFEGNGGPVVLGHKRLDILVVLT